MSQAHDLKFSLVIPAFNEEAAIASVVDDADEALREQFLEYEIIVVDDGSRDHTPEILSLLSRNNPRVRFCRLPQNQGYGRALRVGFEAANGTVVGFTDADGQFDLNEISKLTDKLHESPIVVGCRVQRNDPWLRRFLSKGYNCLARTFLRTRVRDCDCALKVFQRDVLKRLLPNSTGFFVNTEMLFHADRLGYDVVEVPVTHRPRRAGVSKVGWHHVPSTFLTFARFWRSEVALPWVSDTLMSLKGFANSWRRLRLPQWSVAGHRVEPIAPRRESV